MDDSEEKSISSDEYDDDVIDGSAGSEPQESFEDKIKKILSGEVEVSDAPTGDFLALLEESALDEDLDQSSLNNSDSNDIDVSFLVPARHLTESQRKRNREATQAFLNAASTPVQPPQQRSILDSAAIPAPASPTSARLASLNFERTSDSVAAPRDNIKAVYQNDTFFVRSPKHLYQGICFQVQEEFSGRTIEELKEEKKINTPNQSSHVYIWQKQPNGEYQCKLFSPPSQPNQTAAVRSSLSEEHYLCVNLQEKTFQFLPEFKLKIIGEKDPNPSGFKNGYVLIPQNADSSSTTNNNAYSWNLYFYDANGECYLDEISTYPDLVKLQELQNNPRFKPAPGEHLHPKIKDKVEEVLKKASTERFHVVASHEHDIHHRYLAVFEPNLTLGVAIKKLKMGLNNVDEKEALKKILLPWMLLYLFDNKSCKNIGSFQSFFEENSRKTSDECYLKRLLDYIRDANLDPKNKDIQSMQKIVDEILAGGTQTKDFLDQSFSAFLDFEYQRLLSSKEVCPAFVFQGLSYLYRKKCNLYVKKTPDMFGLQLHQDHNSNCFLKENDQEGLLEFILPQSTQAPQIVHQLSYIDEAEPLPEYRFFPIEKKFQANIMDSPASVLDKSLHQFTSLHELIREIDELIHLLKKQEYYIFHWKKILLKAPNKNYKDRINRQRVIVEQHIQGVLNSLPYLAEHPILSAYLMKQENSVAGVLTMSDPEEKKIQLAQFHKNYVTEVTQTIEAYQSIKSLNKLGSIFQYREKNKGKFEEDKLLEKEIQQRESDLKKFDTANDEFNKIKKNISYNYIQDNPSQKKPTDADAEHNNRSGVHKFRYLQYEHNEFRVYEKKEKFKYEYSRSSFKEKILFGVKTLFGAAVLGAGGWGAALLIKFLLAVGLMLSSVILYGVFIAAVAIICSVGIYKLVEFVIRNIQKKEYRHCVSSSVNPEPITHPFVASVLPSATPSSHLSQAIVPSATQASLPVPDSSINASALSTSTPSTPIQHIVRPALLSLHLTPSFSPTVSRFVFSPSIISTPLGNSLSTLPYPTENGRQLIELQNANLKLQLDLDQIKIERTIQEAVQRLEQSSNTDELKLVGKQLNDAIGYLNSPAFLNLSLLERKAELELLNPPINSLQIYINPANQNPQEINPLLLAAAKNLADALQGLQDPLTLKTKLNKKLEGIKKVLESIQIKLPTANISTTSTTITNPEIELKTKLEEVSEWLHSEEFKSLPKAAQLKLLSLQQHIIQGINFEDVANENKPVPDDFLQKATDLLNAILQLKQTLPDSSVFSTVPQTPGRKAQQLQQSADKQMNDILLKLKLTAVALDNPVSASSITTAASSAAVTTTSTSTITTSVITAESFTNIADALQLAAQQLAELFKLDTLRLEKKLKASDEYHQAIQLFLDESLIPASEIELKKKLLGRAKDLLIHMQKMISSLQSGSLLPNAPGSARKPIKVTDEEKKEKEIEKEKELKKAKETLRKRLPKSNPGPSQNPGGTQAQTQPQPQPQAQAQAQTQTKNVDKIADALRVFSALIDGLLINRNANSQGKFLDAARNLKASVAEASRLNVNKDKTKGTLGDDQLTSLKNIFDSIEACATQLDAVIGSEYMRDTYEIEAVKISINELNRFLMQAAQNISDSNSRYHIDMNNIGLSINFDKIKKLLVNINEKMINLSGALSQLNDQFIVPLNIDLYVLNHPEIMHKKNEQIIEMKKTNHMIEEINAGLRWLHKIDPNDFNDNFQSDISDENVSIGENMLNLSKEFLKKLNGELSDLRHKLDEHLAKDVIPLLPPNSAVTDKNKVNQLIQDCNKVINSFDVSLRTKYWALISPVITAVNQNSVRLSQNATQQNSIEDSLKALAKAFDRAKGNKNTWRTDNRFLVDSISTNSHSTFFPSKRGAVPKPDKNTASKKKRGPKFGASLDSD